MPASALSPAMAARLDGQARAAQRAAATNAAVERLARSIALPLVSIEPGSPERLPTTHSLQP